MNPEDIDKSQAQKCAYEQAYNNSFKNLPNRPESALVNLCKSKGRDIYERQKGKIVLIRGKISVGDIRPISNQK